MNRLSSTRRRLAPIPPILISSIVISLPRSTGRGPHLVGCPHDGLDDVLISRAAAQVARERPADLVLGRIGVFLEQCLRRHHHPRGAVAALETVLLLEALLDGVQLARAGETLDGFDRVAISLDREHRAAL